MLMSGDQALGIAFLYLVSIDLSNRLNAPIPLS